ncbi:glycosyltransferase [Pelagibacteraceae bacterium]|nr:glycosyltransferase [Pelagibacteraceae bacterium]
MKKILIFTATYNEIENVEKLIVQIKYNCPEADILIIDDNSPDGTGKLLKEKGLNDNKLNVIIRAGKLGLDTAHKFAYQYALSNNYDYLVTMDADLSHNPNEIPKFLEIINNHDFVLGSRYINGGKNKLGLFRFLLSYLGNKFIKNILSIQCTEYTSSFRTFNLKKMHKFNLNKIDSKGYSFFMETIYQINKLGYDIIEIPIIFEHRLSGKSKIPKIELFRTLINVVRLYFKKK